MLPCNNNLTVRTVKIKNVTNLPIFLKFDIFSVTHTHNMFCFECNKNTTCPDGQSFPLEHLPIGECTEGNYTQVQTFAIAFISTHSTLLLLFIIAFFWKQCVHADRKTWPFFAFWIFATTFLIIESIFVYFYNFIATSTRVIELASICSIIIARTVSNETYTSIFVSDRWLHYVNGISVAISIYISITVMLIAGDNQTIICLLLSWLAIIQFLDIVRAGCVTCSPEIQSVKSAFGVRMGLSTMSLIAIIVGFVLVFSSSQYLAIVCIGISKLFLTTSGYLFVVWPPSHMGRGLHIPSASKVFTAFKKSKGTDLKS